MLEQLGNVVLTGLSLSEQRISYWGILLKC